MKQFLKKPMGLAVAATLAMGGMAAFTNASALTNAQALGDAAIVPYYTTKGNFITGVQIVNTTDQTQVVKVRLRRDSDSADILDFNVIMSPYDHFSGYIDKIGDAVSFITADKSCTAPNVANGTFTSPVPNLSADADEGYIEIIGMAEADDEDDAVPRAALHDATGVPLDCVFVESNFLNANFVANDETDGTAGNEPAGSDDAETTFWDDTSADALKVSYFIRDSSTGMEMGDNATHIVNFANTPMMTSQEDGIENGNVDGFDFPDLDGGGADAGNRGLYDSVIRADLGSNVVLNNWSYNPANNVSTDWVITIPGQYLMINPDPAATNAIQTDIPVTAALTIYDREEDTAAGGSIVVSPGIPGGSTTLPNEVNVIEWGGNSVFGSDNAIAADPAGSGINQPFGWASLSLTSATNPAGDDTIAATTTNGLCVYDLTDLAAALCVEPGNPVPVIGFAAWQRQFDTAANRNYGRIEAHSRY